jgi:pimeloyl-ACP methyl ester carboxylesterase
VARRLADSEGFRPLAIDLRGHGRSDKPAPPDPYAYDLMAADVAAVLDAWGLDEVDVVGGSLGGGVGVHLDRLQPGRVRTLVLCEAIAVAVPEEPLPAQSHMASAALRRRVVWPTREEMVRSYGSRPPLDRLAPEALAAYIEWGTDELEDGQVALSCPPAVEAAIFAGVPARRSVAEAFEHLPSLRAKPVLLAGDCSAVPREFFTAAAAAAGVPLELVSGGHFFFHEDTDRAVDLVSSHLGL